MQVEVAYARSAEHLLVKLEVTENTTVEQAIRQAGMLAQFPEIDLNINKVGIFGKLVSLQQTLRAGDRIEIYRKLIADPKLARRRRAGRKKK
ncbi:MAG TPA: RnfH family protein [Gammaproteobacteria bacterium]